MKVKSSLIAPVLAASLLVPTVGTAISYHKTNTSKTTAAIQKKDQKWEKGEKQKELTNIINQYASPQLKAQLTKDLATRKSLLKQLRQTPGFRKNKERGLTVYQAHKKEIGAIKQQVKDGKLTKQQAHKELRALFGKEKGKEQGKRGIYQALKAAIQKKDQASINSALEKMDQKLARSNQRLQQELNK